MEKYRPPPAVTAVIDEIRLHRLSEAPQHCAQHYLLATLESHINFPALDQRQQQHSCPTTSLSLSTLPAELNLLIVQSLCSLIDVANLIRTARIFRHLWQLNAGSISYKFFPQAIDCFPDAEQLVDAQELVEAARQQHDHHHSEQTEPNRSTLKVKRILSNAHKVSRLSAFYEHALIPEIVLHRHYQRHHPANHFTASEQSRVTRNCYRLWTCVTLGRHPSDASSLRSDFFARFKNKDYYCIYELSLWLTNVADKDELQSFRIIGADPAERDKQIAEQYSTWIVMAREWKRRMGENPEGGSYPMNFPYKAPLNLFAMFDMFQEYLDPSAFVGPTVWDQ